MSRTTVEILQDALSHFEIMQRPAEQGLDERLVIDAVCMRLSAGIEALAALDPQVREEIFADVWPFMWGMRNRIAHGYLLVDTTVIRETLIHDIPTIMSRLSSGGSSSLTDQRRSATATPPQAAGSHRSTCGSTNWVLVGADAWARATRADVDVGLPVWGRAEFRTWAAR